MRSLYIFTATLTALLVVPTAAGTFSFRNRNSDLGADGSGLGGGKRNNPRLPISPEAYMSSVSIIE